MTLVAFDFDGTLTQSDLLALLGREYNVAGEVRGLVEQGLRDEAAFERTLRQRTSMLKGMPEQRVDAAFDRCKLRSRAADLISNLRRSGVTVAIITGSFERGVEAALRRANVAVDHIVANRLVIRNGAVTGDVEGPLLDAEKDLALEEIALDEGVDTERTIAVGNGPTDRPMLRAAGTAIGFKPDRGTEKLCDYTVTSVLKLRLHFEQHGVIDS